MTVSSVEVKDLTVKFGDFVAVNRISFNVRQGEIFGFLGANGAGKTTTIRVLCGLLVPTSGDVSVAGSTFHSEAAGDIVKAKVGYMSQKFTLYNDLTVFENLSFTGSLRKIEPRRLSERAAELLEFVGFNRELVTLVKDLPGGTRQQVSLAASLLHDPEIVFLDEPTAGVTPAARAKFWALIRSLAERGKTVFVTTHYMDEAEQCERIALMRSGEIIALDTPEGLKGAYPEPLFEVVPAARPAEGWLETLRASKAVRSLEPYGMRYHASIRDMAVWESLAREMAPSWTATRIRPSLEDVFIRLVEGEK